jgi:ABC-type transport system substrate-binding protein
MRDLVNPISYVDRRARSRAPSATRDIRLPKTAEGAILAPNQNPKGGARIMNTRHSALTSLSRRDMLRGGVAALMGAYGLAPRYGLAADVPTEYDGSKFQIAAPEPNPKQGGVMRYGILNRPPHFDVHQSGTVGNIGTQGCMFDNLIRRDPRDSGKSIIPDLAHSWEIAKDGKTYTFHLRQGVQFHDGTDFTSDDIKATFDRIAKPPAGISIPRTPLFRAVTEINAATSTPSNLSWPRRAPSIS